MSETESAPAAAPAAETAAKKKRQPKKAAAGGAKKSAKHSGPSVSELIVNAVSASKERSGMSLAALKKALAAGGYDVDKNNSRLKIAVKSLVTKGNLVQVKGTGASGSFKLNKKQHDTKDKAAKPKKATLKKPATAAKSPKKPKKAPGSLKKVKKPAAAKKPAAKSPKKPKAAAAKPKKPAKSPAKKAAKPKVAKSPAKKAPKPKVAKSPAKKAAKPKKAAPKKK